MLIAEMTQRPIPPWFAFVAAGTVVLAVAFTAFVTWLLFRIRRSR